jgi:hypothetical protein
MNEPTDVTVLRRPVLLELNTEQWILALGALKQAGFRILATTHRNRFSIVDDVPILRTPHKKPNQE